MNDMEKILGEAITVKELAEYLGVNEKTVRQNYQQFGGIKIGRHKSERLWQTFKSTKRTFSRVQHSI
jgi:transcription initiation factor TFIIIB Brf1 subunit/transcription initiation factor TFIIB